MGSFVQQIRRQVISGTFMGVLIRRNTEISLFTRRNSEKLYVLYMPPSCMNYLRLLTLTRAIESISCPSHIACTVVASVVVATLSVCVALMRSGAISTFINFQSELKHNFLTLFVLTFLVHSGIGGGAQCAHRY